MSETNNTALVKAGPKMFMGRPLSEVVKDLLPPETAPLSPDDWKAMPETERLAALEWFLDELQQNTEGVTVGFPRIKYPGSGTAFWQLEGPDGKLVPVSELRGVILTKAECRVFYKPNPDGSDSVVEGAIPDCMSADCVIPDEQSSEKQSKTCATCPQSKWGSGKGGMGQACKKRIRLYQLLRTLDVKERACTGSLEEVPTFISLPPTAIRPISNYVVQLSKAKKPLSFYETSLGLVQAKSKGGKEYAGLAPGAGEKLNYFEAKKVKDAKETYGDMMRFRGGKDLIEAIREDEVHQPDLPGDADADFQEEVL